MADTLLAGVGRESITPPIGIMLAGALRDEPSAAVERDLTATALVLQRGDTKVAIIALDLIRLPVADANVLRVGIGKALGVPATHVLVNTSHTHATPDPPEWQDYGDDARADETRRHWDEVRDRTVRAAVTADMARVPAVMGSGEGSVRIGVNRREQLPDGTMVLGEDPNGIIDPAVGVVRIDRRDGGPLAVLFTHACHPDILGPKSRLISPDFVGAARAAVETVTGATALFLQGTAGDIDPRCSIVMGDDGVDELCRLGGELGCEAARVFFSINPRRERHERVAWRSAAAVVTAWSYRDRPEREERGLTVATRRLRLPLRPLPSEAAATAEVDHARGLLQATLTGSLMLSDRLVARKRLDWTELQLDAVRRGGPTEMEVEVQAMRLDDVVLIGIPGEVFVEIGLAIKAASAAASAFVLGYTNGTIFYIPTAKAFAQGGYEVSSHRNYHQPAGPTPEWEARLVEAGMDLIHAVTGSACVPSVGAAHLLASANQRSG